MAVPFCFISPPQWQNARTRWNVTGSRASRKIIAQAPERLSGGGRLDISDPLPGRRRSLLRMTHFEKLERADLRPCGNLSRLDSFVRLSPATGRTFRHSRNAIRARRPDMARATSSLGIVRYKLDYPVATVATANIAFVMSLFHRATFRPVAHSASNAITPAFLRIFSRSSLAASSRRSRMPSARFGAS